MSSLKSDFDEETYYLFEGCECWWCGEKIHSDTEEQVDALHHILGRCSKSPFNGAPIHNNSCHLGNGKLSWQDVKLALLVQTARYLKKIGYEIDSRDEEFMNNHLDYFKQVNKKL